MPASGVAGKTGVQPWNRCEKRAGPGAEGHAFPRGIALVHEGGARFQIGFAEDPVAVPVKSAADCGVELEGIVRGPGVLEKSARFKLVSAGHAGPGVTGSQISEPLLSLAVHLPQVHAAGEEVLFSKGNPVPMNQPCCHGGNLKLVQHGKFRAAIGRNRGESTLKPALLSVGDPLGAWLGLSGVPCEFCGEVGPVCRVPGQR